jgi:penicillin-binding protein 1A
MLRETLLSGTARKADLPGWPAAGKTGTSQEFRDAWFVGYTDYLVTGVWLGNDDSSSTKKITGGGLPVEVWSRFMKVAHQGVPIADLPGVGTAPTIALFPPVMIPSATVVTADASRPQPVANRGLDGWFLDKLFGRR